MFSYNKDRELEELVDEYVKFQKGKGNYGAGYEIGKAWPDFEISDLHEEKGFSGEEYGFNPHMQNADDLDLKARLPKFAVTHIDLDEQDYEAQETALEPSNGLEYLHAHGEDMDLMKNLSCEIHRELLPFVNDVLDEYDYEGSAIYNDSIDRELINHLVGRVIEKSALFVDKAEVSVKSVGRRHWDSHKLLNSVVELSLLNELFGFRRPRYRHICPRRRRYPHR